MKTFCTNVPDEHTRRNIGTHTVKTIPAAIYPDDFRTIATVTIKFDFFFNVFQIRHIFCNELFVEVLV